MRILVTGAAGFLGSHLTDLLVADGHTVIGVDNLATGRLANLEHLQGEPRFSLLERDICQPFEPGQVDAIYNLASPASPADYMRLGVETLRVGAYGVFNTLDIARRYRSLYLHASTSECYGDPEIHPQPESYWGNVNPIGPRSVYDEAKRFAEATVMAYHRYRGVNTRMARIFNTYGPRLQPSDGRVISNFLMQALRGEDLTIYGDGSQTRSFCYVTDLIDGIVRLAASDEHEPVNIGNPEEWSIADCAREVLGVTGSRSKVRNLALPVDDPARRRPDITRARTMLGWEPKVQLREGLNLCIPYFTRAVQENVDTQPSAG
ncbi:MAG TPA: UDP-glucuronic acid decarboxylase family protein [Acidobacteriaceae bacterium]|nr:UDP-glucuronic acid decarboxylase family protein [Acidobacteriaceae bacterium]